MSYCAIDFGTSNSSVVVADHQGGMRLVTLEDGQSTIPTAVFFFTDELEAAHAHGVHRPDGAMARAYGRAAVAAYVDGYAGRLMRSLKSILGSSLAEQTTDLGNGYAARYLDVITGYLRYLRRAGETSTQQPLDRVVLGRPVFFVDDDAERDARAQATLTAAAQAAGFRDVRFQFEPIAAAFDYEQQVVHEQIVLVADIGGGTSDFSVVRVGPAQRLRADRRDDILANHGVHIAGTDFDRQIELAALLPLLGFGAHGPGGQGARPVPSTIYHDLATWHLINTCYRPRRVAEWRAMVDWFAEPELHRRLMRVLELRLGHELAAKTEAAKISASAGTPARVALDALAPGLAVTVDEALALEAIRADLERIVEAAVQTVRAAGLPPERIDVLYLTGGSTGMAALTERLSARFATARSVQGDRLASVAMGLGVHASRMFGTSTRK
jgi:hypothetical chaperone protein